MSTESVPAVSALRSGTGKPELWLIAGVHGDEYEGIACAREAIRRLRPDRGTLVAIPVAHPMAVARGSRLGIDGVDLNRVFPGAASGGATDRVAAALWQEIAPRADALITIHSWHRSGLTVPYVEHQARDVRSRELAHALGLDWVEPWEWHPGLLPAVAAGTGIPAVEIELGGLGAQSEPLLELGVAAVRNALVALEMLDEAGPRATSQAVHRDVLRSPAEGIVHHLHAVGQSVRAGEVVARIHEFDGSLAGEVLARRDGLVAAHQTYGAVNPGDEIGATFHPIEDGGRR